MPDGSCDITAHVALDACALPGGRVVTQRAALRALGVSGARPALTRRHGPHRLRARSGGRGEAAELTATGGLGDFGWLLQPVGIPNPMVDSPLPTIHRPTAYLSMSPTTKNSDPRIATMSATSVPGSSSTSAWMLLNEAERSFSRYGSSRPC